MCVNGELDCATHQQPAVWFFTLGKSLKVSEMESHGQQVNLSFSNPSKQTYLSLSGVGSLTKNRSDMESRWKSDLKTWFPQGLDTPDLCLLKVCVNQAEYWDVPSSVSQGISFLKAKVTGHVTTEPTVTHQKLTMEHGVGATGAPIGLGVGNVPVGGISGEMGKGKAEHKEQTRAEEAKMVDIK
jgi:general stress protein 26